MNDEGWNRLAQLNQLFCSYLTGVCSGFVINQNG